MARSHRWSVLTPAASTRSGRTRHLVAACAFFVTSGAAALVYQVAWQRLLALTTGVAVHSVAIITAAFMAGLGIGSHAGGMLSARLTPRQALLAFALIELGVAAFAAVSVPFYYGLLYQQAPFLYDGILRATLTHLATLLPPTVLMGMSLPFVVRGLVRSRAAAPRTIGFLYGANALGAAAGAFLTPWFLLRFLGVEGAVLAGAAGSAFAALGMLAIALRTPPGEAEAGEAVHEPEAGEEPARAFSVWVALYALSGFVSLSLEVAWFRVLDLVAKGPTCTFGTLLAIYLVGLAAGTFAAARYASRVQRPLSVFLACQVAIVVVTVAAHALLVWLPASSSLVSWLIAFGARPVGVRMDPFVPGEFFAVFVALPLVLFGPSTFLMGFGFPVLQRATQGDPVASGRRVGLLQGANIAGCLLGSLVTGLLLLETIGTSGVFRVLSVVGALLAFFAFRTLRDRRFAWASALLSLAALVFPSNDRLWMRLLGDLQATSSFVEEDAAGVTALAPSGRGYKLWIGGRHNSWLPFGWLHTIIGALPAVVHEAPLEVAVVGLGSGDTAWAAACRQETRQVRVFEIASSQPRLIRRVAELPVMGRLREFLADPRIVIVKDDGRRRLRADRRKYDIIVADSVWHDTALSGYLYSVEYFELVRDTLKPGGLVCALTKVPRIRASARRAFPHAVSLGEDLLLASPDPIVIDKAAWLERLKSARLVDYLGKARTREIAEVIERAGPEPPAVLSDEVDRDLVPRDEFLRPHSPR